MIFQNASVKHAENGFLHIVFSEKKDVGFCRECLYPLDYFGFYYNGEKSLCTTCYNDTIQSGVVATKEHREDERECCSLF